MLNFSDTPYEYYPPKPNGLAIRLLWLINRFRFLSSAKHRIRGVEVFNSEPLQEILKGGSRRILWMPNHSTHSDPELIYELQRRFGAAAMFMAAYDVFQRSKVNAFVMQRTGVFSVDRDGGDTRAMKQAMDTLVQGKYGLTVFPEGNVYFMNDRVTPFLDGAAFMGMKAQKELGPDIPVYAVPVAIKLTHLTDQRETIRSMIRDVAATAGIEDLDATDPVAGIKRAGIAVLERNLHQRGYLPPDTGTADIKEMLRLAVEPIIAALEEKADIKARPKDELVARIRRIRSRIHDIRTDPEREADHPAAVTWADEAILAMRILSYAGDYLDEKPTLDRVGETAEKLREDVTAVAHRPYGDRHAYLHVGTPIDLSQHLESFNKKARTAMSELTGLFEETVQDGLDRINSQNPHPGGEMF